jgi:hypothetical protein
MVLYCRHCQSKKNYSNVKQISAHLVICEEQQQQLKALKQTLHTKQIKLNDDNLLDNDYVFDQVNDDSSDHFSVNETLYERAKQHNKIDIETSYGRSNAEYHSSILLLDILQKAGCPLRCFDEIVNWAKQSRNMGVDFNATFDPNRAKILRDIDTLFDLHNLTPTITPYKMLSTNEEVPVVHIDFLDAIYSLLNDKVKMDPKNLLDDDLIDENVLDDVNSGSVYRQAKTIYVKDPKSDKMIPIILWMDKTHTDINGRLKLEPVMFTLGIFKRECQADPSFWRTIGFVTDTANSKKANAQLKLQDYHNILEIILRSYIEAQCTPIKWEFVEKDGDKNVYYCWLPRL